MKNVLSLTWKAEESRIGKILAIFGIAAVAFLILLITGLNVGSEAIFWVCGAASIYTFVELLKCSHVRCVLGSDLSRAVFSEALDFVAENLLEKYTPDSVIEDLDTNSLEPQVYRVGGPTFKGYWTDGSQPMIEASSNGWTYDVKYPVKEGVVGLHEWMKLVHTAWVAANDKNGKI